MRGFASDKILLPKVRPTRRMATEETSSGQPENLFVETGISSWFDGYFDGMKISRTRALGKKFLCKESKLPATSRNGTSSIFYPVGKFFDPLGKFSISQKNEITLHKCRYGIQSSAVKSRKSTAKDHDQVWVV